MLYPFRFAPLFRRYLWGGRRLQTMLGKELGSGNDYAESWEIVDHGKDQSVVCSGHLAGVTLHDLVERSGAELFGADHPQHKFPLLFKFLDAQRDLSVQVHPNDLQAAELEPPDLGKTEAWVILAAEEDSTIYAGLQPHVDPSVLRQAVAEGNTASCLHQIKPRPGDCIFIPAGTVHALGAGLLVAEIQQASDTTFRLFDWNRVGADGRPRELHVEQALHVINYDSGPVQPQIPGPTPDAEIARLVDCDKFVLDRWTFHQPKRIPDKAKCRLLVVLSGGVSVAGDPCDSPLVAGQSMLIPACCGGLELSPAEPTVMLDICLP